jgi:hypothetical protein
MPAAAEGGAPSLYNTEPHRCADVVDRQANAAGRLGDRRALLQRVKDALQQGAHAGLRYHSTLAALGHQQQVTSMLMAPDSIFSQGKQASQTHLDGVVLRADQEAGAELGAGRARIEQRRAGVREPAGQGGTPVRQARQPAHRLPPVDASSTSEASCARIAAQRPKQCSAAAAGAASVGAAPHQPQADHR